MHQITSETDELRRMYNFGNEGTGPSGGGVAGPPNTLRTMDPPAIPTELEDLNIPSDTEENNESLHRGNKGMESAGFQTAVPTASAFGTDHSITRTNDSSKHLSVTESSSSTKKKENKGSGGHKMNIAKEVLGLNKKSTKGMTPAEKQRHQLEQRWHKAMAEEQRLSSLEAQVSNREIAMREADLEPNFPPKFLCIKPLVHHDMEVVPETRRKYVKVCFVNWIVTSVLLLVNMGVAIGVGFTPRRKGGSTEHFNKALNTVLAIVYLIGSPLSFIVWYWPVYRACSTRRHTKHILSLCGLIVALAFSIFIVIGHTSYGACGIELAIHINETRHRAVVLPVIIVLFLWAAEAVFLCYCICRQWIYYRRDVKAEEEAKRRMHEFVRLQAA